MIELRDYQETLSGQAADLLRQYHIAYLAFDMRTGKTLTALSACNKMDYSRVLFITKKKAIASVESDYSQSGYAFKLKVVNYEQVINLALEPWDVVIVDEAQSLKAYPKPSGRTCNIRAILHRTHADAIFLSGTPTPEGYSDIYHQFWVSAYSPFVQDNFYKWCKEFVNVKQKMISGRLHNDYSHAIEDKVKHVIDKYMITYTREEAEFTVAQVKENIVSVDCDPRIETLKKILVRDRYYKMADGEEIVCDTPVSLQNKLHQISSGTVITESGVRRVLDYAKAHYIKNNYVGQRIAVFYKFQAEGDAIRAILGDTTDSPEEFATGNKPFVCQVQTGSMGVDLSTADVLIFYNIDFSAVQYWQARDRLLKMTREKDARVDWLFNVDGIEPKIYEAVRQKKDYTNSWFNRDYNIVKKIKEVA